MRVGQLYFVAFQGVTFGVGSRNIEPMRYASFVIQTLLEPMAMGVAVLRRQRHWWHR